MQFILLLLSFLLLPMTASAQQLVDAFGDWRVFTAQRDGKKTCYLASLPIAQKGTYSKREEPYILVTDRGGNRDEVSISAGYRFAEKSEVTVLFGQKKHSLFTHGDLAWAYDKESDQAIVRDMIRGKKLVVNGKSWKNTTSSDTYSLKGFTDAHRRMKQACK